MTTLHSGRAPILARYRPGGAWWFLVLLFPGMGGVLPAVMICTHHTHADLVQAWTLAGIMGLFGIGLAMLLGKAIDTDDTGLTVFDWRGRRRIPWEDVQDYYLCLPRKRSQSAAIQTPQGLLLIADVDSGYNEILQCVVEHTGHLPIREWGVLGCRPDDPATIEFRYTWCTEAVFGVMSAALTLGILVMVSHRIISDWQLLIQFAGLGWAIGFVVLALHLPVLFGLMTWACYLTARDIWVRRNDRLTVTASGIQMVTPLAVIDAPWTSVVEWHSQEVKRRRFLTSNIVIVTQHGTFDVSSRIGMNSNLQTMRLLRMILEQHAGPDTQPPQDYNAFPNAAKRWAGIISEGAHVHHYRTPVNRALLLMACAYALTPPLAVVVGYVAGTLAASATRIFSNALAVAILICYAQWRYRTAAVITDDDGIRVYTVFGERRLRWKDITDYRKVDSLATVRGKYNAVRFWLTISEAELLQQKIQERAVNSKTREWKL